ncbi:PAS domain-containing sensor histidine kinase [Xylanibacter ruminicola]|uniref:histidine kinase n=1 Tax=Xylanibacter ruminicola TaxID=839 RepID=A0A1M6VP21_XYLRU|nr:PAS domain-containing sensor histidine kinase [Xylanibacter ruminicola]SHK83317.1 PAS domain S-box-containing protein [Xylanibacter ruminicola]
MLIDISHTYIYLIAAFIISAIAMVVYNRLTYYKEKRVTREVQRLNAQLTLIMDANKTDAWTYNTKKNVFKVISKKDLTKTFYTPFEFSQLYDREDFKQIVKAIESIQNREQITDTLTVKGSPSQDGDVKTYEMSLSVLRRNKQDLPIEILGTQRDVTQEKNQAEAAKNLMLKYHTVFNSSLVDMIYYDADGYLAELNEKACETFGVKNPQELLRRGMKMTDIPSYRDIDIKTLEHTQLSSITDITQVKATDERVPEVTRTGKIYYEVMLEPIHDIDNQSQGVIAAGRDITEMVESHHRQQESARLMEERTKALKQYIDDLNYTLKISDARLTSYYPESHTLEILSDLSGAGTRLSQLKAIAMVHSDDRKRAKRLITRMDRLYKSTISETVRTKLRDHKGRDIYLNFSMMPITDKEGKVTHYFGMCRNETEMAHIEKHLQEETAKAQEEEQLKNAFLLNMSYELRVPLHAVIGFAELFKSEHNREDEPVFANEIKKNTDVLLGLINDILFISRLDAHMIEYHYEVCDFAAQFEKWCQKGWADASKNVKQVIENSYNSLLIKIDPQNLGTAIQKLCGYSALTTKAGSLKSRYEYLHDELIIIVEDTGQGMEFDEVPKAFNRFMGDAKNKRIGTGLDLPIVKELVEQMGGTIDVLSAPGKGNTFFMSIPCEMNSFEKK